jgi:S-(hydroxymethyl)glutathione dehydrogenase/alcohol dehydrogenase
MKTNAKSDGPPSFTDESGGKINFGECCTFLRRGVFPANRVSKIDESVAVGSAALLGCALVTAYAAVRIATRGFKVLDRGIAIVGAGGIGMAVALLAKSHGLRATCIDLPSVVEKLEADTKGLTIMSTKIAATNRAGEFPIVIICAGVVSAFELGQLLLPKNSGVMVLVGNPPAGEKIHLDVKPLLYGREVIGVGEKDVSLPDDLDALVNLIKSGRLESERLIRRRFSLSNIQSALEITDLGLGGRTLIEID